MAVGRTLCISFSTATPLIATSLITPIVARLAEGVSVGGKGAALGAGAEDNIAVAGVRFKLAVELNIYLELTEKVRIL